MAEGIDFARISLSVVRDLPYSPRIVQVCPVGVLYWVKSSLFTIIFLLQQFRVVMDIPDNLIKVISLRIFLYSLIKNGTHIVQIRAGWF